MTRPTFTEAPLLYVGKFAQSMFVAFMVVGGMPLTVMAVWSWATASRQPSTHEPSPSVLALTGGYQAQGGGR